MNTADALRLYSTGQLVAELRRRWHAADLDDVIAEARRRGFPLPDKATMLDALQRY